MNKRLIALALTGTLLIGLLAACGGGQTSAPETETPAVESPSASPELEPTPTPEETPETAPETTPPAAENPSEEPSQEPSEKPSATPDTKPSTPPSTPSAKPSAPPASSAPSTQPQPTPTPEPEPQVDVVQSTWNAISQYELPSLMDVDADTLSALYGISSDDLVSYVCKMPALAVHATEFFIAEVKEGKMDTVKAAVESRQAALVQQWSQYLPEQLELVENYQLVTSGNYILFAVSEYADEAVSAFNSYTN